MNAADVLKFLRAKPFRPFRIQMVDGSQFEIRHPEFAIVTPTIVAVGIPSPLGGDVPEHIVHLSLSHVLRIEAIEPATASPQSQS